MENKKVLLVYAHPNAKSFCASLRDLALKKLTSIGFEVLQSDLYEMNFNPVLTLKDVKVETSQQGLSISEELKNVAKSQRIDPDIQAELDKVHAAKYLIFIAPTWWGTFPAIMKGWFDRVLLRGATFDFPDGIFDNGLLKGKKCLIVTTTGWNQEFFSKEGKSASGQTIEENYWHIIEGVFAFCGMETLPVFAFYGMDGATEEKRAKDLKEYENVLETMDKIKPITCPMLNDHEKKE